MQTRRTRSLLLASLGLLLPGLLAACAVTNHPSRPARLGTPSTLAALEASLHHPGPIEFETVAAADWQVPLEGLVNLEHPRAQHLEDRPENIQIYFHAIAHPRHGLFIVDTGVAAAVKDPKRTPFSWPLTSAMNLEALKVHVTTEAWLKHQKTPLAGVFLTHLHLDHILGLPAVPRDVPVYTGPGEAESTAFKHAFIKGTNDDLLEGRGALHTWRFGQAKEPQELAVVDVFGDASVFALHVPGHTPGSTAFVVRTKTRPVLLVGDASHTTFGWEHEVEPGTFSSDRPQSVRSLRALRGLVQRHPAMAVKLGHQPLPAVAPVAAQMR